MKLHAYLILFGCIHGLLLASVLISRKNGKNPANKLLAAMLLIFSAYLLEHFLILEGHRKLFPHLISVSVPFTYLLGPLYYFYIRSTFQNDFSLNKNHFIHVLPVVICFITMLAFYIKSAEYKITLIESFDMDKFELPVNRAFYFGFHLLQTAGYIYFAWLLIKKQKEIFKERKSKKKEGVVKWLQFFTGGFTVFLVCYFAGYLLFIFTDFYQFEAFFSVIALLGLLIYLAGYWAIKESSVIKEAGSADSNERYKNSKLTDAKALSIKQDLLRLLETEKIYRESNLTLNKASKRLSINSRYLSQIINQEFDCRFTDLINYYRIDDAKRMLKDKNYSHWSILGIAQEVGFNNKNTFIRAFKLQTKEIPSDFRKSN